MRGKLYNAQTHQYFVHRIGRVLLDRHHPLIDVGKRGVTRNVIHQENAHRTWDWDRHSRC